MTVERVFRGRRVVIGEALRPASLLVSNGRVAAVAEYDAVPEGAPLVDVGDLVISPGVVDSHVHLNEPGRTEWEGFETATRAAAAGGVTTLVDMPLNSIPPTTTVAHLEAKRAAAEGRCAVDVGFWGGAIPGNAAHLRPLLDAGALGFKCFLVESGVDEFPCVGEADLREALAALADTGAPLLAHAELAGPIDRAAREIAALDPRQYATYMASRPPAAELEAIALLVRLCEATRARVHVVHLAAAGGVELVRRAKDAGLPFSAETTSHYLHFAAEEIADGATPFKCAPPIRGAENREGLWQGVASGVLELVVSDHSPCTPALKRLDEGHFGDAWGGIAGLQVSMSAVWTEALRRGHTLVDLARWMSRGPAELAGLSRTKGSIEVGKDADLVIWDPDATFVVDERALRQRHKRTPYDGRRLRGRVIRTYAR
ncbi:MAG TPA: allantoinase AllB, partial [Byssovorax sp.]